MKYLIIGGSGFIGSNLATRLASIPDNQVEIVDKVSPSISNPDIRINVIDISTNPTELQLLMSSYRPDIVIHCAFNDYANPSTNLDSSVFLLGYSAVVNVKKFIFISSTNIYYDYSSMLATGLSNHPDTPAQIIKLAVEGYVRYFFRDRGINIRLSLVYGNTDVTYYNNTIVDDLVNGVSKLDGGTITNDPHKLNFIYIDEVVSKILDICNQDKFTEEVIPVSSLNHYTIKEVYNITQIAKSKYTNKLDIYRYINDIMMSRRLLE